MNLPETSEAAPADFPDLLAATRSRRTLHCSQAPARLAHGPALRIKPADRSAEDPSADHLPGVAADRCDGAAHHPADQGCWIAILLRPSYFSAWVGEAAKNLEVSPRSAYTFFWAYVGANLVAGILIVLVRRIPPSARELTVFLMTLIDGIFLGVLTVVTGGYNSPLYWLFLGLIVRTAVSVPRATSQLLLNLTLSACFIIAGVIDSYVALNLPETDRHVLELYSADNPAEPLLLRLVLLLLMTLFCYAAQVLLEHQRRAMEEAREFAMREGQLRSAGRLAAEFAHQIKNPLAIINNAAFSLQRAIREHKGDPVEQIQMIQEEVERADRIITQVMGYAQLSEGRVEKLDVRRRTGSSHRQGVSPGGPLPAPGPTVVPRRFSTVAHAEATPFGNVYQRAAKCS